MGTIAHLESAILTISDQYLSTHTRADRKGEGELKVEQYMREFRDFYNNHQHSFPNGFPVMSTPTGQLKLDLQLSDEDARYTTDVSPGIYCKQRAFDVYNITKRADDSSVVIVWDLFCSPGMDILYLILKDHLIRYEDAKHSRQLEITGVSRVGDQTERNRFIRMKHNIQSLLSLIPDACVPQLHESTAKQFCESYHGPTPDILLLNPPWMESMGEIQHRTRGSARSVHSLTAEMAELIQLIKANTGHSPSIIACSVPYDWDHFCPIIDSLNEINDSDPYVLDQGIRIAKKSRADPGYTISTYHTFILRHTKSADETPHFHEYTYFV